MTESGNQTILLVDDEESIRSLMLAMLEFNGYEALVAESSLEALALFRENAGTIKLVITDVIMPKMTGIELGDELRKISPDLKIIYMSGYMTGDLSMRVSGSEEPVFLQKPFSADTLVRRVQEALA